MANENLLLNYLLIGEYIIKNAEFYAGLRVLTLTNLKIISMDKKLICGNKINELPLERISSVYVKQGLFGHIFNYGDVIITGIGGDKITQRYIKHPLEFRQAVLQAICDKRLNSNNA